MLFTIFYYSIISFIFIFVVHYLYEYFKENLTIPKEKDLIEKPKETYNKIYETLGNNKKNKNSNNQKKNELKNYLKQLKTSTSNSKKINESNNMTMDSFNINGSDIKFTPLDNAQNMENKEIQNYSTF